MPPVLMTSGPEFTDVHETDAARADAHLRLDHAPAERFAFHAHRVTRGPLNVEETRCTDGVRMRFDGEPGYVVSLPVEGRVHADHRGSELDVGPGQAAVFAPLGEASMATGDRFDVVVVRLRSGALEDALEALLGRAVRRPLPLPASITLDTTDAGRDWAGTVRTVACALPGDPSMAEPLVAEPLQDTLLVGLLHATDHPDRDALNAPVPTWGPRTVRGCLDFIEAHPQQPLTSAALAAGVGLSVLALEGCWRRHRDRLPRHDVERVRLGRAHGDLEFYRPGETTVGAVATAWGFRPRPFVAAYGARFGRSPEQTLRGPAYA